MSNNSLRWSIYRLLAVRIALVAIVISAIFGTITWVTEQQRMQAAVVDLARVQVERFNQQTIGIFDQPGSLDRVVLREELDEFSRMSGRPGIGDGRFVLARILDAHGAALAQITDREHANIDAVSARVDLGTFQPLAAGEHRSVTVDINDVTYVGVAIPMTDSRGQVVAQIVGAFALSPAALERLRGDVAKTVAYIIAIILVTALALYPIIANLLGRMSGLTVNLLDANLETMRVLGSAIAKRDSDTDAHNYRVTVYSVALAEAIGLSTDQTQSLIKGALLHDVGKLGIRDNVLLKPGKLDEDEFSVMKTHVQHGIDITARAKWLSDARGVVGGHHEKFDGTGYPRGIAGADIPITARIFAIVDVFDALTSRRPYKEPFSYDDTMEILERGRGSHFDPAILDAFNGIAADLYAEFGGHDDDRAQRRLETLSQTYFRSNIADLMG